MRINNWNNTGLSRTFTFFSYFQWLENGQLPQLPQLNRWFTSLPIFRLVRRWQRQDCWDGDSQSHHNCSSETCAWHHEYIFTIYGGNCDLIWCNQYMIRDLVKSVCIYKLLFHEGCFRISPSLNTPWCPFYASDWMSFAPQDLFCFPCLPFLLQGWIHVCISSKKTIQPLLLTWWEESRNDFLHEEVILGHVFGLKPLCRHFPVPCGASAGCHSAGSEGFVVTSAQMYVAKPTAGDPEFFNVCECMSEYSQR